MATLYKKKIKDVFNDSLKNIRDGKKPNVSGNMRKRGYSETSSRALKVKKTKTWEQLLKQYLPDNKLAEVHKELLENENWKARDSGLDKGYKLKGKYTPEKVEHSGEITTKVTNEELEEYKKFRKCHKES